MNAYPTVTGKSRLLLDALLDGEKTTAELAALLDTRHVATYVLRLRRALGSPELVQTTFTGYRLDLPPRPAPVFQLPAPVSGFVGRTRELDRITATTVPDAPGSGAIGSDAPGSGAIGPVVISGPPGIGKTALAITAGHALASHYPDGQLYVDLRGYAPEPPLAPSVVLSRFLRALGVEQVPTDPEALGRRFRALVRDARLLVVLDNARSADQVRPLLPGTPTCGVLITSRSDLPSFPAIRLGTLHPDEAASVVHGNAELAEWCGYYPLALRIALGNLVDRPDVESYVDELRADRLTALSVDGDTEVRRTFHLSFAALDPADAELFGLLGTVPGPDFSAAGATALAGTPVSLDRLVQANLVQQTGDRFALHDLLREYALERAPHSPAAAHRLFQWYLDNARSASAALFPEITSDAVALPVDAALAWITAERSNVLAAAAHCARNGPVALSWQLVDAVGGFLGAQGNEVEYTQAVVTALDAARRAGDRPAEAAMLIRLASAYRNRGDLRAAYELFNGLSFPDVENPWLPSVRGTVELECGDLTAAAASFREVLGYSTPSAQVSGLFGLGTISVLTGDFAAAAPTLRSAADLAAAHGLANHEAACRTFLALCLAESAEFDEAISLLHNALALRGSRGASHLHASTLAHLTLVLCRAGRLAEARTTVTSALEMLTSLGGSTRIEAQVHHAHGTVLAALGLDATPAFSLSLELSVAAASPYDEMRARLGLGDVAGARALAARHGFHLA
ncbi:NTPase [Lentzea sp. NBRC 105346]|uniref:hypothetical protein n=1 Tax=Lentzea sp. NBRC 105346 TaxID=3032205 RepID=UPI0024A07E21|nr:hypothetical protein [Lentzea sp. NBRC 105346]GLZ28823.1 NTPase [Lentzea sp. NBRC 105346]